MLRVGIGRIILALIAGYAANAALIGISEALFLKVLDNRQYFVVDLITQIIATISCAYLCCFIAQRDRRIAAVGMAMLGVLIGTASLVSSWSYEPHWYGIFLLCVYAPCVGIGYALMEWRR